MARRLRSGHLQRKNYLYFQHTGASADAPVCHFYGWGRKGERHLLRLLPAEARREPSQSSLHDARFPLLSLRDIFPRPGEVFPLRGALFVLTGRWQKAPLSGELDATSGSGLRGFSRTLLLIRRGKASACPQTLHLTRKPSRHAKGSPFGRAGKADRL